MRRAVNSDNRRRITVSSVLSHANLIYILYDIMYSTSEETGQQVRIQASAKENIGISEVASRAYTVTASFGAINLVRFMDVCYNVRPISVQPYIRGAVKKF